MITYLPRTLDLYCQLEAAGGSPGHLARLLVTEPNSILLSFPIQIVVQNIFIVSAKHEAITRVSKESGFYLCTISSPLILHNSMQFGAILYTLLNLPGQSAIVKRTSSSKSLPRVGVNIHCFSSASQNKNIVACSENKNQSGVYCISNDKFSIRFILLVADLLTRVVGVLTVVVAILGREVVVPVGILEKKYIKILKFSLIIDIVYFGTGALMSFEVSL